MSKPFELGFIIGRFNHIHNGHIKMIDVGLQNCNQLLLMVGSSQESGTERNPFNLFTRMTLIRNLYWEEIANDRLLLGHIDDMTHEGDHSKEWGYFVLNKIDMWKGHYGVDKEVDCFIYGNDEERTNWYDPEKIKRVNQIVLSRSNHEISATIMRERLAKDNYDDWCEDMPKELHAFYGELQDELSEIQFYKQLKRNGGWKNERNGTSN